MKKFKSVLSLILALLMVFSCFAVFAAEDDEDVEREIVTSFSDVDPSSVMGKAISDLAMLGIVTGYPDGTFAPNDNITRAEFATICVRLANLADGIGTDAVTGFPDLDNDDTYGWARPYILMAKNTGMINGYTDGNFGPGDLVTYEQVIAVLMRMRGWGETCDAEAKANPSLSWSYAYIKYANSEGLTKNAMTTNYTQATSRGMVAILANNSRTMRQLVQVTDDQGNIGWRPSEEVSSTQTTTNDELISGVVTATHLAYIVEPDVRISKNEIMIDDEVYTLTEKARDSVDMYDILGKSVKVRYDAKEDTVSTITVMNANSTDIYSGYVGSGSKFFLGVEDGRIQYSSNTDTFRTNAISLPETVIYNGKIIEDFYPEDLEDEDSPYFFKTGVIQIYSNGKYNFAKISNYDTYVVNSTSTTNQVDYIRFMYRTGSDYRVVFPNENDADYFVFRRGKTNITSRSDLRKFDVLSVLRSPEDADGPTLMIIEVSRNSLTNLKVTGINENDENMIELSNQYYQYNYDYENVPEDSTDEVPELSRGTGGVNIYLDHLGLIAAVSTSGTATSDGSFAYGYLLGLRQNDRRSDYDLEFYILDANGKEQEIGTGSTIQIDGKRYNTGDDDILDLLEETADMAAASYRNVGGGSDLEGVMYQQPIRYKQNTNTKLITAIDTLADSNIGDDLVLSAAIDDGSADADGRRTYNRSSGFPYYNEDGDESYFLLSSDTKIFFIPDNRTDYSSYGTMTTSSFTAGNKYYVEAYNVGTTRANRADLVVVYKTNDKMEFNHTSPFLIVTDYGTNDDDEETISGYRGVYNSGVSTSPNTTVTLNYSKLSSEARSIYNSLGKGDIVRYITGTDGKVTDLELWLDASDPMQEESVGSVSEAVENRILAIRSSSSDPVDGDAYNAAFRLAYGTVLRFDEDVKTITVSPTLDVDYDDYGLEMAEGGTGVVAHMYGSSTRVFVYNGRSGASYLGTGSDAYETIASYEDVQEGASVIVTFSTGDTTNSASPFRMIYIIR